MAECGHQNCAAEAALLQVAEQIERALDDEMERIDNIDDDDIVAIRRRRMQQLQEMANRRDMWLRKGHGSYNEITDPKHFFDVCQNSERVICHFKRRSTTRCEIMDRHFRNLAPHHVETMICYVDVERLPALAEKFNVLMLPHIMLVENKNTFHSIIGFDEFGGVDDFTTQTVELVLNHHGMLNDRDMFAADQSED